MNKAFSILALSLSLAATTASAAGKSCPNPSFIQHQTYALYWHAQKTWLFASSTMHAFVFVEGSTLKNAKANVKIALNSISVTSAILMQRGYCIYRGGLMPSPYHFWPTSYPTIGYS